jgi:hypothetical protein
MPILKPSGKKVRVSFSVKRPRTPKTMERLVRAMEKVVRKHGGKVKRRKRK